MEKNIYASHMAARPDKAVDQPQTDGVFADDKDNRDCRGRSFGCKRTSADERGDHGNTSADEVGHQHRQPVVLTAEPVVLYRHVLAFDIAGFAEAFAEGGCPGSRRLERPGI